MDHKWRWRRKSSGKTIVANGRSSLSLERNFEEDQDEDAGSLKCPSNLSDRLPPVICDCSVKEELIRKHRRTAEQALAGQEMERAEAAYIREELDKALQQGELAEKKLAHLNAALKDCTREIESLREQQNERVQSAFSKAKLDYDKERTKLEAKLTEANRRISNLSSENANLMKALICKERLLHDLDKEKDELESENSILAGKLESSEKENTYLKYEFQVMEKELERWNQERKSGCKSEIERLKQINHLEAECQQLRHLVSTKLVEKQSSPVVSEQSSKGTSYLINRVYSLEEENSTLREILALSDTKLQSWRNRYGQMGSRLVELEAQIQALSVGENSMQLAISGLGIDKCDGINDSELWANALLVELEQFREGKLKDNQVHKAIVPIPEENTVGSWLDEILKVMLEEHRVSNRSLGELLEDVRIALGQDVNSISKPKEESCSEICGLLTWEGSETREIKDASFAREKIRKHFGFQRSKSDMGLELDSPDNHNTLAQMIAIQSTLQDENKRMKEKLQRLSGENVTLRTELQKSEQKIESLQKEVESFKESEGLIEDQIENQRLINEDLSTQLTVSKAKLNEIFHKLSSLEVELDHRNNCCDELEATCLELQLQLETVSRKESPNTFIDEVAKQLFDQAFAVQHASLRDHLMEEQYEERKGYEIVRNEGHASNGDQEKSIVAYTASRTLPAPRPKASSPEQVGTLAVVSSKRTNGGFGFIRKLFFRRKRGCNNMKAITLQRNTSIALMKQRDLLLVV